MELEKRIEKIKDYFVEMKIIIMKDDNDQDTHVIYVTVKLPEKWIIDETTEEKYGVSYIPGDKSWENQFSFFAELKTGIDKVFDAIDYNVQSNIIAEKKVSILHDKMEALKKMFQNEKYDVTDLESLDFNFRNKTVCKDSFGGTVSEKKDDDKEKKSDKKEVSKK